MTSNSNWKNNKLEKAAVRGGAVRGGTGRCGAGLDGAVRCGAGAVRCCAVRLVINLHNSSRDPFIASL